MVMLQEAKNTKYPEIGRVGVACVHADNDGAILFAHHFPLPGEP